MQSILNDRGRKLGPSVPPLDAEEVAQRWSERRLDRHLLLLGSLIYPGWGLVFALAGVSLGPPLWELLLVGLILAVCWWFSGRSSHFTNGPRWFFYLGTWLLTAHHFSSLLRHDLIAARAIGTIVIVTAVSSALVSRREMILYTSFVLAMAIPTTLTQDAKTLSILIFGGLFTILITNGLILADRVRMLNSLTRTEHSLRVANQRNALILSSIREGFMALDRKFHVVYMNAEARRLTNLSGRGNCGNSLWDLFPESIREEFEVNCRKAMLGDTVEFEAHDRNLGLWMEVWAYPSEAGITIFLHDVVEKKRLEAEVAEQKAKALYASKMSTLGEMAGGIAHEINNPLAVIHGRSQQLREMAENGSVEPEVVLRLSQKIEETAMRISRIVKALRAFAREGENEPTQLVSLKSIVDETLELCRERFSVHGVDLRVDALSPLLHLDCRSVQISQVLLNLLANAYDAVEMADSKWVSVQVRHESEHIEIHVCNSGPPLDPELAERVFEPFFTTKDVGRGTGLGLSISKGLIESHGGQLFVDLTPSHTCFVVRLPGASIVTAVA